MDVARLTVSYPPLKGPTDRGIHADIVHHDPALQVGVAGDDRIEIVGDHVEHPRHGLVPGHLSSALHPTAALPRSPSPPPPPPSDTPPRSPDPSASGRAAGTSPRPPGTSSPPAV